MYPRQARNYMHSAPAVLSLLQLAAKRLKTDGWGGIIMANDTKKSFDGHVNPCKPCTSLLDAMLELSAIFQIILFWPELLEICGGRGVCCWFLVDMEPNMLFFHMLDYR